MQTETGWYRGAEMVKACLLYTSPKDNEPDLYDVDEEVKKNLTFLPMQNLSQVLAAALLLSLIHI